MSSSNKLAVVILAAGKGSRMKSAKPKVLHPVAGRPIVGWLLETAENLNPDKIVVVIGPEMDDLAEAVQPHETVIQDQQNGTADAIKPALPLLKGFEGQVLILLGDEPFVPQEALEKMIAWDGISVMAVEPLSPKGLGRMVVNDDGTLHKIVEDKDCTDEERDIRLCNAGNFCVPAKHLEKWISLIGKNNAQGEYYLTDLPEIAEKDGFLTYVVTADTARIGWGINTRAELALHENIAQDMLRQKAMAGGATLLDPGTVYLSWDTKLGQDVIVEQNVVFGPGVDVADNVVIHPFTHIEGAAIEAGANIGPFARVRPKSKIGEKAVIGNFIEVNRSEVQAGAKAKHVTYLGDAVIGPKANIGAGTVIANYDGFNKHDTKVGAGAFIGTNTTLVAPIEVGDGAIVAAGSTITKNVPENALSVARNRPMIRDGWAEKYREQKKKAS